MDELTILSASKGKAIIQGTLIDEEIKDTAYTGEDCVLWIKKEMLHDIIDKWLDGKEDYYNKTGGSYAGVGSIVIEKFEERKQQSMLNYITNNDVDHWESENRPVRTFDCFEFTVDMEHG